MTSKYSISVNGKQHIFKYKKSSRTDMTVYTFYIGDIYIGQLFKMRDKSWSVVSSLPNCDICPVDGFNSRYLASDFLLKLQGYIK